MQQFPDKIQGIFWFLISRIGLAILIVSARYLAETISPFQIVAFQNIFALLFFIPIFRKKGIVNVLKTKHICSHIAQGVIAVLGILIWYCAFTKISLTEAVAVSYALPLFTIIIAAVVLKEKILSNTWMALLFGFIALSLILKPGSGLLGYAQFLILIAAFLWAISDVLNKKLSKTESSETIIFYMSFVAAIISIPFVLKEAISLTFLEICLLIFMGAVSNIAYISTAISYKVAPKISVLQPFDFLRFLLVVVFAKFIFAEYVDMLSVFVVLIILLITNVVHNQRELAMSKNKVQELMGKQKRFFMFVMVQLEKLHKHLDECVDSLKICKNNPEYIEDLTEIVGQLNNETKDLISRVHDLENINIGNLKTDKTTFNLLSFVESIKKELLIKANDLDATIQINLPKSYKINTDKKILKRAIKGVLMNSLDIRNLCSDITISLEQDNVKGDKIFIKDNGIDLKDLSEHEASKEEKQYKDEILKFNYDISKKLIEVLGFKMSFNRKNDDNIIEILL